jgi:hypothetical protein
MLLAAPNFRHRQLKMGGSYEAAGRSGWRGIIGHKRGL